MEKVEAGEYVFGGCVIDDGNPTWRCQNCGADNCTLGDMDKLFMETADKNLDAKYNLERFWDAQHGNTYPVDYSQALEEIKRGRKSSHWVWYIFPQMCDKGSSTRTEYFRIKSKEEAQAYMLNELLSQRLIEISEALLEHKSKSIVQIVGHPDDLKILSSLTLFSEIAPEQIVFKKVLEQFYGEERCERTMEMLAGL